MKKSKLNIVMTGMDPNLKIKKKEMAIQIKSLEERIAVMEDFISHHNFSAMSLLATETKEVEVNEDNSTLHNRLRFRGMRIKELEKELEVRSIPIKDLILERTVQHKKGDEGFTTTKLSAGISNNDNPI